MQRKLSSLTDIALHVGNPLALFVLAGRFVLNESMTIMLARCPEHLSHVILSVDPRIADAPPLSLPPALLSKKQ